MDHGPFYLKTWLLLAFAMRTGYYQKNLLSSIAAGHGLWELCESIGGHPGLLSLIVLMVPVDVKQHWTSTAGLTLVTAIRSLFYLLPCWHEHTTLIPNIKEAASATQVSYRKSTRCVQLVLLMKVRNSESGEYFKTTLNLKLLSWSFLVLPVGKRKEKNNKPFSKG